MKVNELMHNDLFIYGGNLCRFVIRSMDAIVQRLSDKSEYKPCAVLNAKPIPLTEEILKANGFRESIEEGTYYFPEYCEAHDRGYALETVAGVWFITEHQLMLFTYVHELQHALRLCGFDELADNFVIR